MLHPNPPLATPSVHPSGINPMNISEYTDKKDNESIEDSTVGLKGKVQWEALQSTEAKEVRFEHLLAL